MPVVGSCSLEEDEVDASDGDAEDVVEEVAASATFGVASVAC